MDMNGTAASESEADNAELVAAAKMRRSVGADQLGVIREREDSGDAGSVQSEGKMDPQVPG